MTWSWQDFLKCVEHFGKETTIHGVYFLAIRKLHILERLFWIIIIALAAVSAIALSLSNWNRYSANPTVVSIRKDFRNWDNPFPAATGCFLNKVDEVAAEDYIIETWGINDTNPRYNYYLSFITAVANISYRNLEVFNKFKDDKSLIGIDMTNLATKVHPKVQGTLVTFDTKRMASWTLVLTELGICFSVNSQFSDLLEIRGNDKIERDPTGKYAFSILRCHYLNGLCYARYDSESESPVNFHVHSYLDIVHATSGLPFLVGESQELEINYRMQETTSKSNLKSLSPAQRGCRFEDEPISDDLPVYSTTICYMLCRYKLVLKLCGCRPFFYNNLGGKICDIDGLLCVAKHIHVLTERPSKSGCKCPQPCNIITYLPETPKVTFWEYGYFDQRITFRWGLLPPTTKYTRDIIFGFEDLVVSLGGIVALFLGISFISIIEVIFYLLQYIIKSVGLKTIE